jgi:hypothetical protein
MSKFIKTYFSVDIRRLNFCSWLVLFITYVTPYRQINSNSIIYGYPFAFLKVNSQIESTIPLISNGLSLLPFFLDILIVHFVLVVISKIWYKYRNIEG